MYTHFYARGWNLVLALLPDFDFLELGRLAFEGVSEFGLAAEW